MAGGAAATRDRRRAAATTRQCRAHGDLTRHRRHRQRRELARPRASARRSSRRPLSGRQRAARPGRRPHPRCRQLADDEAPRGRQVPLGRRDQGGVRVRRGSRGRRRRRVLRLGDRGDSHRTRRLPCGHRCRGLPRLVEPVVAITGPAGGCRAGALAGSGAGMTEPLIIGAMVRTLGAYPSGWRHPGAHTDPQTDAQILRRIARLAEDARLDYLFFGDWLATGPDLEFRDPYLLARIDPLSAVLFLAGITERIGLIATVNSTYADPYATARATASLDLLTAGRGGVNLVTGAEPRAAANHGREAHADNEARYNRAEEFVLALRLLWESWDADAWVADADRGVLIDTDGLRGAAFAGAHVRVEGALNVARPPQQHPPIVHAGTSPRSRALAASEADLALIAAGDPRVAAATRAELRALAADSGRDPDDLKVIVPILPVVAETDAGARAIVARLLELVPIDDGRELPAA